MSRSATNEAKNQLKTTNAIGAGYNTQAGNLYGSLEPQLESEATNPQGYSKSDLSAMQTASAQGLGGSTAGITGQANLNTARTRNSAGYGADLDQAAQTADQTQSQNDLDIQAANANLKQQQQQTALSSLGSLYNTGVSAGESYYGMAPSTINAQTNAGNSGWLQNTEGVLSSLGSLGGGVGAAAKGL
jgi:hypothetical protein